MDNHDPTTPAGREALRAKLADAEAATSGVGGNPVLVALARTALPAALREVEQQSARIVALEWELKEANRVLALRNDRDDSPPIGGGYSRWDFE